jgi:putative methyltransferase (TIGR04325 family)
MEGKSAMHAKKLELGSILQSEKISLKSRVTGMKLTQIAKYVLPPIGVDAARWLLTGRRPTMPEAGHVGTHYELVSEWTTAKEGTGTFDFDVAKRSAESELDVPVVRDNLGALTLIDLPEAKLLDFGCGNGHYRLILSADSHTATWDYVGVDIRPDFVQFCRQTYPKTCFETVEEGSPLPFADNAFDIVLASGVIQYIQNPVVTLVELCRVTQDYVLLSRLPTWKYHDSQIVVQRLHGAWGEEQYPLHVFNRYMAEGIFAQVGFSVVFRDYGSEFFSVPGEREPVAHILYLLRKPCHG